MCNLYFYTTRSLLLSVLFLFSCNKLVEIPEPKDTLTTVKVFTNDAQAQSAMAGVLSAMINGLDKANAKLGANSFSNGQVTIFNASSADETTFFGIGEDPYGSNSLTAGVQDGIWASAYQAIYGANAIIEGIAASTSPDLRTKTRVELAAEAKFIRAFSYFYLINNYGDVPLSLTIDFNQTVNLPRAAVAVVYQQIINDLLDAIKGLPADYATAAGERIRVNKWGAKAMLARVYLFTGNNTEAVNAATEVIGQTALYQLETTDLNRVFLKNSLEAIWQLQQNSATPDLGTATREGYNSLPNATSGVNSGLSTNLLNAFEPGDLRRSAWVNRVEFPKGSGTYYMYASKYKTGADNRVIGTKPQVEPTEYYMVLRLAEQYLIRAEAAAIGGQTGSAIDDLNVIRRRAGLGELSKTLTKEQVLAAVAKERQTELFMEWGHRWMDLKRTGKAEEVLSAIPQKQPWKGSYQLLYPIPIEEIRKDHFLTQNPNY
jgi:hypothetical protein